MKSKRGIVIRNYMCGDWALPNDHPILQMLLQEIGKLRERATNAELRAAMYYRHASLLSECVDSKTAIKIRNKIWGK